MTDRRRRQKDQRAAKVEAQRKADSRREVFRRIGFALVLGLSVVALFIIGSLGGGDEALPGTYDRYRAQPTACGADQPPPEAVTAYEAPEPQPDITAQSSVTATLTTSCGDIVIDLDPEASPRTVESFAFLAREGFYDGTVFHRILDGFVAQGGDPEATGAGGPGYSVPDEHPADDFVYEPGAVAMANAGAGTTGSQFFIVLGEDAAVLTPAFNLLGRVVEGEETLDLIAQVPTVRRSESIEESVPVETVYIESVDIDAG